MAARFAAAREAHPEFAGKVVASVSIPTDTGYFVLPPRDPRLAFFTSLGFVPLDSANQVSREQLAVLDEADLLFGFGATPEDYADEPLFQRLAAVREGRIVFSAGGFEIDLTEPIAYRSPLSLPYALDLAVPAIAAALDGDPATEATR